MTDVERMEGMRFIARGYFTGDGQHWQTVYDTETGLYVAVGNKPYPYVFYRSPVTARHLAARLNSGQERTKAIADVALMHAHAEVI